jgi:CRP-like cAMP-binding protein
MTEGEQANNVMVIRSGWTRITAWDNGGERLVAERGPGQLVSERAALRQNVRSATVTALNEVTVLVMKTEDFASFVSAATPKTGGRARCRAGRSATHCRPVRSQRRRVRTAPCC